MNLKALAFINENAPELLDESAKSCDSSTKDVEGIARQAVAKGYASLSGPQKFHFNKAIRPLIENVKCSGYIHEFEESPSSCENILDDNELVDFYENDGGYCESCAGQASADRAAKDAFFKE